MSRMLVFDIETDGLLEDLTLIHCGVAKDIKTKEVFTFGPDKILDLFRLLNHNVVIGHNIISFDIPALEKCLERTLKPSMVVDTLVMSRVLNPDRERPEGAPSRVGPNSLESWGLRLGFQKGGIDTFDVYSEAMLQYCVRDVDLTEKVYFALLEEMKS